ncbi:RsmD family RNA methyltransferase [Algoriphagus aestuariicola]|uniref:RsmD family RNA methyltransferase n=1 Tax=Algoriphagus aestuariicola TaxID=1852016 RepID=A0ABS3BRL4_9BACT|nr:class I SAM-dependent methyltransferase [Algoriphagus aestuariicola]MBN7801917.1 RsmD family RNA methyltransferase [Algoriphagus aestuariicola]
MDLSEINTADFRKFVQDHLSEDPALLLFKYQGKVAFDLKAAVQQISARQKAAKKLPEWAGNPDLLFPASISLEQSSSEETARFKATGTQGKTLIDLTGGFGVDFYYLSRGFEQGVYCERQAELFQISKHNLEILGPGNFDFHEGDGLDYLKTSSEKFDLIYADPARRGAGNEKLYKLQDCEPDVVSAWQLLKEKGTQILIKVSPMLDISQAWSEIPDIQQITVVSVKNEVKELLLFWKKGIEGNSKQIRICDLGSGYPDFVFKPEEEVDAISQLGEAEKYLIEPRSSILKAGAFKLFGERFGLKKLDTNSHLFTSSALPEAIPARVFEIVEEVPAKKSELKSRFPQGKVNVLFRNYATKPEEFKKKFGLKDGGEKYLIGTKSPSGFKVFCCKRVW